MDEIEPNLTLAHCLNFLTDAVHKISASSDNRKGTNTPSKQAKQQLATHEVPSGYQKRRVAILACSACSAAGVTGSNQNHDQDSSHISVLVSRLQHARLAGTPLPARRITLQQRKMRARKSPA